MIAGRRSIQGCSSGCRRNESARFAGSSIAGSPGRRTGRSVTRRGPPAQRLRGPAGAPGRTPSRRPATTIGRPRRGPATVTSGGDGPAGGEQPHLGAAHLGGGLGVVALLDAASGVVTGPLGAG